MHAYLIVGPDRDSRKHYIQQLFVDWKSAPFDRIELGSDGLSVGIDEVRLLEKRLNLLPVHAPFTIAVVYNAHNLTNQAQQALLKTLEEPPAHAKIILETYNPELLIPTIPSRCQMIPVKNTTLRSQAQKDEQIQFSEEIARITQSSIGQRLIAIDALPKTKDEALAWVTRAMKMLSMHLAASEPSPKITHLLRKLLIAEKQITANVSPRMVLDMIFLSA